MRNIRLFAVTLSYKRYGPAIKSWYEAQAYLAATMPHVRLDWLHMHGNPQGLAEGHAIVTAKYREAQQTFRAGDWEMFIAIEDDMIIPHDTFPRLLDLVYNGADIGYGLYVWRHGYPRWSAYTEVEAHRGVSLSDDAEQARAAWGNVVDVVGVGNGCTIYKRHVLEAQEMRRGGPACNDWYMAMDAQKAGYTQRCDLGLLCGHMTTEPSPRVLWPDVDDPDWYRTEYLAPPPQDEQERLAEWHADDEPAKPKTAAWVSLPARKG